jgi:lysozyme
MKETYLDSMRRFEGFCASARPDGSQLSNGYGTRALSADETISRGEADARFRNAVSSAERLVEHCAPGLDEGTKAALTSLTYNTGVRWMKSGLGDAVRRHDYVTARELFQRYTTAGGQTLPGLVSRRSEEAKWFGGSLVGSSAATEIARQGAAVGVVEGMEPATGSWSALSSEQLSDGSVSPITALAAPLVRSIEAWWSLLELSLKPPDDKQSEGPSG